MVELTQGELKEVSELRALQHNDEALHRQQELPIVENLRRKIAKGIFDADKAAKLLGYLFDNVARKYRANSSYAFTPRVRREAAHQWVADFIIDVEWLTSPECR